MLREVDDDIFVRRYFGHCMACTTCADSCCEYGVDVSKPEHARILARADEIRPLARRSDPAAWFLPESEIDADYAGGEVFRTTVVDGRCVFLRREGRGCVLHGLALEKGEDYHEIKPMVSSLFPLTWDGDAICCAEEIEDGSLACITDGPTVYEMARAELEYYFGAEFVAELDQLAVRHSG